MPTLSPNDAILAVEAGSISELEISGSTLTYSQAKALAAALTSDTRVTTLDLNGCDVGTFEPSGFRTWSMNVLATALIANKRLITLVLNRKIIGDAGAAELARVFGTSNTLKHVDCSQCEIGNGGAAALAKGLGEDKAVTFLNLRSNKVGARGAREIGSMLEVNAHLQELDLSGNQLDDKALTSLASGLGKNKGLKKLSLSGNLKFKADGVVALARALEDNTTLEILDLNGNPQIQAKGIVELAKVLKHNTTLRELDLRGIFIGDAGFETLIDALENNFVISEVHFTERMLISEDAVSPIPSTPAATIRRVRAYESRVRGLIARNHQAPQTAYEHARAGRTEQCLELLRKGVGLHKTDDGNILHAAVRSKSLDAIKGLLAFLGEKGLLDELLSEANDIMSGRMTPFELANHLSQSLPVEVYRPGSSGAQDRAVYDEMARLLGGGRSAADEEADAIEQARGISGEEELQGRLDRLREPYGADDSTAGDTVETNGDVSDFTAVITQASADALAAATTAGDAAEAEAATDETTIVEAQQAAASRGEAAQAELLPRITARAAAVTEHASALQARLRAAIDATQGGGGAGAASAVSEDVMRQAIESLGSEWAADAAALLDDSVIQAQEVETEADAMVLIQARQQQIQVELRATQLVLARDSERTDEMYERHAAKQRELAEQAALQSPAEVQAFYNALEKRLSARLYSAFLLFQGGMLKRDDNAADIGGKVAGAVVSGFVGTACAKQLPVLGVAGDIIGSLAGIATEEATSFAVDQFKGRQYKAASSHVDNFKDANKYAELIARRVTQYFLKQLKAQKGLTAAKGQEYGGKAADAIYKLMKKKQQGDKGDNFKQMIGAIEALAAKEKWFPVAVSDDAVGEESALDGKLTELRAEIEALRVTQAADSTDRADDDYAALKRKVDGLERRLHEQPRRPADEDVTHVVGGGGQVQLQVSASASASAAKGGAAATVAMQREAVEHEQQIILVGRELASLQEEVRVLHEAKPAAGSGKAEIDSATVGGASDAQSRVVAAQAKEIVDLKAQVGQQQQQLLELGDAFSTMGAQMERLMAVVGQQQASEPAVAASIRGPGFVVFAQGTTDGDDVEPAARVDATV